jgi:hypothetical protein
MPKLVIVWRGWIGAKPSDLATLESMGVEVSAYNYEVEAFDRCSMPEAAYHVFVRKWQGYRVWGLIRRTREVYTKEEMEDIPF